MTLLPAVHDESLALAEQLVAWPRDFHGHPELGFHELRTAGIVADHLTGPHHNPAFDFDEAMLPTGVALLTGGALCYLNKRSSRQEAAP